MIIVTSLSPNHKNRHNQQFALNSWNRFGKAYSLNTKSEIEDLSTQFVGVEFIETHRTGLALLNKPLVNLNAIFDFAISKGEGLLLINSDIIIDHLPELKEDGITIFSRYDYTDQKEISEMFTYGFDMFYIPYEFLTIFPPSVYCLGASWHDFVTPYRAILNNVPLYYPKGKFAFHKWHETQYSHKEWEYMGSFFKLEFKLPQHLSYGDIATYMMQEIKKRFIHE